VACDVDPTLAPPTTLDRRRLVAVLGMLASAHDGEVLDAATFAHRLVTKAKLTWEAVVAVDRALLEGEP
jgi:hypothetical protein